MRTVSAAWSNAIRYSHRMVSRVDSYLAGTQIAANLPIDGGRIDYDITGNLKRRLTLTVPARTATAIYDPAGDPNAPLACYGQRLHVGTGVGYPNGATEILDHGWYLITSWNRNDDEGTVEVEAMDLARLLDDDRLTTPQSPLAGATFASEFVRLLDGMMPAVISAGLVDRAVPATLLWERERLDAIAHLCAAWPARWWIGDDGAAHADIPYPAVTAATPLDLTITDGVNGTIGKRARAGERGALYNTVVVDGLQPDDGSARPHAIAAVTDPASPIRANGPYGPVTRFYESDLIATQAQAQSTADTLLVTYASAGRSETATAVPDPAVQLGDVARLYTRDGQALTGRVTSLTMPLTVDQAPMQLTVGMLPREDKE